MATAGTVTVKLDGDSASLIRELNKANEASKSTFNEMKREAAAVAAKFAVIATAAGAAFAALTKASFESIDQLAKTADRLGVSTEALQTLQLAAELAGVSQEQLTKSLQKQQKALVDASDGSVTAERAFARLGLNVQALIKLPADQQFAAIAEAIGSIESPTRRNAIAFEIWGAKAGEMINLAMGGTEGMKEFEQLLKDLNVTVSRFDASKIEQANDAMVVAGMAFKGVGNTIAVAVSPYITQLAKDFTDSARAAGGFKTEVTNAVEGAAVPLGFLADRIFDTNQAFRVLAAGVLAFGAATVGVFAEVATKIDSLIVQPLLAVRASVLSMGGKVAGAFGFTETAEGAAQAAAEVRAVAASIHDAAQASRQMQDDMAGAAGALMDEVRAANNLPMPSDQIDAWLAKAKKAADEAAAEMSGKKKRDLDVSGDPTKADKQRNLYAQDLIAPKIAVPKVDVPRMPYLDPDAVRDMAALGAEQYLEAWKLANEQRRVAEEELRATLLQSDEQAGVALIELAAAQAREKVIAEWQARGQAISETGETADPAQQAEFELAVQEQMLANEADMLNRRLSMQQQFGGQYLGIQRSIAALMGKTWADGHKKTLTNTAAFASATMSITQSLFGQNKKVSIAMAIISTLQGAANALSTVPYPANLAAAATVLASGFAQVNSIRSTNIGSTSAGGGVGGGLGGAPSVQPTSNPTNDAQENRRSAIQVVFQGDVVGWDDFMRDRFVSSLRDLVDGNDVILFGSNSRQAAEIRGG